MWHAAFKDNGILRPEKSLKKVKSIDGVEYPSYDDPDRESMPDISKGYQDNIPDSEGVKSSLDDSNYPDCGFTEIENTCLPAEADKEAIFEYESVRATNKDVPMDLGARFDSRNWITGRSSIYVDAFNLALGTVLEDEGPLFDNAEKEIFDQWKSLDYEAQYLSVLLSLLL
jgi:Fanconi-associated nuclease 1